MGRCASTVCHVASQMLLSEYKALVLTFSHSHSMKFIMLFKIKHTCLRGRHLFSCPVWWKGESLRFLEDYYGTSTEYKATEKSWLEN